MNNAKNGTISQEPDVKTYMQSLLVTDPLREPETRCIIKALELPIISHGLDVGCGIGTQAIMLAESVGSYGHITGLDIRQEFIEYAREVAKNKGLSEQISFEEGDFNNLPFDDNTFDWAWSCDCVGYNPSDPIIPLRELARVVKPNGSVIVLFYSSEQLLPGYPVLEAHLKATSLGIAPFSRGDNPESHCFHALGWLQMVGLEEVQAQTFTNTVHAPLTDEIREALAALIDMRWSGGESELSQEDRRLYQRLTNPDSPDFILNLPDYYAFYTHSLFRGKKGAS